MVGLAISVKNKRCPAHNKECKKCHTIGHFEKICKTKSRKHEQTSTSRQKFKSAVHYVEVKQEGSENYFAFSLQSEENTEKVTVTVGGIEITLIVDSGASCNVID